VTRPSDFERTLEELWSRVRRTNLYGGRPSNADSAESVAAARSALDLAKESNEPRFMREAWCMMAFALNANEEYLDALVYYRQAIPALEDAGELQRAARMRLGFMMALSTTGQSQEALDVGREAEASFREQHDLPYLARLATNLGAVYQRLDDYERGAQYHFEAAELFKRVGDDRSLAQAYLNMGNTLCSLDRFAESEEMYAHCESLSAKLGLEDLRAQSLFNKAHLYFFSGRLSQALATYRDARLQFQSSGSRRHAALCDLDEAEIYVQLRLPHDALVLAQAAADSFAKLDNPYEQGKAIVFGGVALTQKRQFGDALTAFKEAQSLMKQDGNSFWDALLDLYRAEVLFSVGRLWEAHSLASSADAKFAELGYTPKRLVTLVLLGRVAMALGRLDEAELHARLVQEFAAETKTSLFLFACHALSAEVAERDGRMEQATLLYERAAHEIELKQTHLHHDELGITFYKSKAEIFESLVCLALPGDSALGTGAAIRAYSWCEKAKAQVFVDALAPHLPAVRGKANEALIARVERLRGELNGFYLRMSPEFLATPGLPTGEGLELREDELVRTLAELSKSDSEYVSLQIASSVHLPELQQALPDDTTLVEYFFARDEVIVFLITRDKFRVVRHVTPTKRVEFLTGRLQYHMGRFAAVVKSQRTDTETHRTATDDLMRRFYQELMAPVVPYIGTSGLIIVPHGILHRVPFHAFHDGDHYLADLFDITYAPSGSVLKYCLDRPDVIDSTALQLSSNPPSSVVANFMHMPARIALRQDNPVLSRLEFANGTLCIPDIYASRWETNLLSLCAEDLHVDVTGGTDGLQGLVRSLLYAGCRSVLIELWKVRREPSERFFAAFYSEWLGGKTKQRAMAVAQQDLRQAYPHPFDWAPFILTGRR